jgi:hypothetical protein
VTANEERAIVVAIAIVIVMDFSVSEGLPVVREDCQGLWNI